MWLTWPVSWRWRWNTERMSPHLLFLCSSREAASSTGWSFLAFCSHYCSNLCVCEERERKCVCGADRCVYALSRLSIYDFIVKTLHVVGLCDCVALQLQLNCLSLPPCGQLEVRHFFSNNTVNTLLTSAVLPWDLIHEAHQWLCMPFYFLFCSLYFVSCVAFCFC